MSRWRLIGIPAVLTGTAALAMGIHWYARSAPRAASPAVATVAPSAPVAETTASVAATTAPVAETTAPVAATTHAAPVRTSSSTLRVTTQPRDSASRDTSSRGSGDGRVATEGSPADLPKDTERVAPVAAPTVATQQHVASDSAVAAIATPPLPEAALLRHSDGKVPPLVTATALERPITIDGRLSDSAWDHASVLTGLTQLEPDEGHPGSEATTVRVLYDADAIYIGARLYDSTPSRIIRRLDRRDANSHSDEFIVFLDSYHDHRTAFEFAVNAAGVQSDELVGDDGEYSDKLWDAVWEAATAIDSLGWSVELRIPFSQLRFEPHHEQVWGVRFERWIERKNELDMFPFVAKTERGNASRFAHLIGLHDISAPRRGELLPFTVARGTYHRPEDTGNPFDGSSRYYGSAGLDLKYGVSSSLTLDGTVNPDFGQVELDPAFVNLTQFEQFLDERRPFFVEGGQIFGFGGTGGGVNRFSETPLYLYSRRIGRPPEGDATSPGFVDMPTSTTILGAAKLSGKVGERWSVGVLDALTARERATVFDSATGTRAIDDVEPFTNYFAGRLKGDFQGGNTTIGFLSTAVDRDIRSPSLNFLRRAAYAEGLDLFHRWGHNTYTLSASLGGSYIRGDTLSIQEAELSSDRYYQRPDARHFHYDPSRTSLSGISGDVYLNKIAGHWNWGIAGSAVSPGFEVNDLGFQERVDQLSLAVAGGRWWTHSGKLFRKSYAFLKYAPSWNYDGDPIQRRTSAFAYGQFHNFWSINFNANYSAAVLDDRLTRGGPVAAKPAGASASVDLYSDTRKRVGGYAFVAYSRDAAGGWSLELLPIVTLHRSAGLWLSLAPEYIVGRSAAQYVEGVPDSLARATLGTRYVFAELLEHSLEVTLRANAALSPALSFQLYAQPFTFSGAYHGFKELRAPRTYTFDVYGRANGSTIRDTLLPSGAGTVHGYVVDPGGGAQSFSFATPDFRTRAVQFKAVLRWEYRPGSTLFVAWTQSRSGYFAADGSFSPNRDFGQQLFHDRPTNVLLVKVNYWMSW